MNTSPTIEAERQQLERARLQAISFTPTMDTSSSENERPRRRHRHRQIEPRHYDIVSTSARSSDLRDRLTRTLFNWSQSTSASPNSRAHQRHIVQAKYGAGARANSPAHPAVSFSFFLNFRKKQPIFYF